MDLFECQANSTNITENSELNILRRLILISCSISFTSLLIIFVLFTTISDLRSSIHGKYWILNSATALVHHSCYIVMRIIRITHDELFDEIVDKYYSYIFCVYFSLEFSLYMWLNVICYDIFVSLK
jgi:hypothetical protein